MNTDYQNFFDDQEPLTEQRFSNWLQSDEYTSQVAELNGQVVAYFNFRPGRNTYFGLLGVHPDFRRQGIGMQIIEQLIENLREQGTQRIHLEIREQNIGMRCLITRMHFTPEGFFRNQMYDGSATIRYVRFL